MSTSNIDPVHFALALVMGSMAWAGANLWSALIAIAIWVALGRGLFASQRHRLVCVGFYTAPVVLGLNISCTYVGVTTAGVLGAIAIRTLDARDLGYLCAGLVLFIIVAAEWATLMTEVSSISTYLDSSRNSMRP